MVTVCVCVCVMRSFQCNPILKELFEFILFIFGGGGSLLLHGLSLAGKSRDYSLGSLGWLLLLQSTGPGLQELWLPGSRAQAQWCGA